MDKKDHSGMKVLEVNGVALHYAEIGDGKPVLMVHGNGESHEILSSEIRRLSEEGYRVCAPDSRGHGANAPLPELHYGDMAEDMYQLIRKLGLEKPAFYGFSDGGIIGLMLEMAHPGTLGLLAVSGVNLSPEGLTEDLLRESAGREDPLTRMMLTEPHIPPEALGAVRIPVLVTAGENDVIRPEETKRIAEHLPQAELLVLAGETHGSYVENSEVMGELLVRFFRKYGY